MAESKDDTSDFSDSEQTPLDMYFNLAADHVRTITSKINNYQLLQLYGLYKQGTEGDCHVPKPSWFDMKGLKKWEAWKALNDMSSIEAKQRYVALVHDLDPDWSQFPEKLSKKKETWVAVSSFRYSPEPVLMPSELSLIDAARENLAEEVAALLSKNPELRNEKDNDGLTALHWAADRDAVEALKACIKGKCLIDAVDNSGQTPLHYAASCGHLKTIKILIEAGASIIKDNEGNTPLDLAADEVKFLFK